MELRRQVMQKVQKADADGDVDHRHGFVRNDHAWIHRERARDRHPLALSAGKLMRIFQKEVRGRRESDTLE